MKKLILKIVQWIKKVLKIKLFYWNLFKINNVGNNFYKRVSFKNNQNNTRVYRIKTILLDTIEGTNLGNIEIDQKCKISVCDKNSDSNNKNIKKKDNFKLILLELSEVIRRNLKDFIELIK